ncbi:extracellular matrix binding protein [Streptococcus pyogenes]|nr:extracellular matrix binding protein [Streptococcus pyogenes]
MKALIAKDPTLTQADKDKQTAAVDAAKNTAIAAVDKATTAEGINQELGKGITAINKAYRPGEGVEAHKEAAKANLEKVAKETKALISGDRYLSETEKAVQKQAVEQALAKALGQVEAAKTVEAVKLAENLGTVAIRAAYVPNKAVAKSSSANHLPKSGDANSIVLVGLGVMSLLLGMVLYSKKKESKD